MLSAPLGRSEVCELIPHAGTMCLLDAVTFWDATTIVCTATSHRDAGSPLASEGALDALCGVEYAAQAMAVHGGLTAPAGRRPTAGFLASVREVVCLVPRLDQLADDLEIIATRLAGGPATALYQFTLRSGGDAILTGRAAVVLDA